MSERQRVLATPLDQLLTEARAIRDAQFGSRVTYSPKAVPYTHSKLPTNLRVDTPEGEGLRKSKRIKVNNSDDTCM